MLYFNLSTGNPVYKAHPYEVLIHLQDDRVYVSSYGTEISITLDDDQFEDFCSFIENAPIYKGHYTLSDPFYGKFYIALEDEDEDGYRNLCFIEQHLYNSFEVKTEYLNDLANFLREESLSSKTISKDEQLDIADFNSAQEVVDVAATLKKEIRTCSGEWISGSGGHRKHKQPCNNPASFDDDIYAYCDEHWIVAVQWLDCPYSEPTSKTDNGFQPPKHTNADAHAYVIEKLNNMTSEEFVASMVKAGIYKTNEEDDIELTEHYK
jgi:hypothetical protein